MFRRARNPSITPNRSSPRRVSIGVGASCFPTRRRNRPSVWVPLLPSTTSPYDSVRLSISGPSPRIVRRAIVVSNASSSSKDHSLRSRSFPSRTIAAVSTAREAAASGSTSLPRFLEPGAGSSCLAYPSLRSLAFSSGCASSISVLVTDPSSNSSFRRRVWSSSHALRTRFLSPRPSMVASSATTSSGSTHSESTESLAAARALASPDAGAGSAASASFAAYARSRNASNPSSSATRAGNGTSRTRLQHFE